ncbi:MAG: hypothetical protein ACTSO9_07280 [Candidatus Helarchaeota archaeon]
MLLNSVWPKFRANLQNTGQSALGTLPSSISKSIKVPLGEIIQEPIVGYDENIYAINNKGRLYIINLEGSIIKEIEIPEESNPPTFLSDGSFFISSIGIVQKYNSKGDLEWENPIDGIPTSITVNSNGIIYFAAHSFDWAGLYALKISGDRVFDIPLMKDFEMAYHGEGAGFSSPALASNESIIVGFRYYSTYTWDTEEGPEPEHQYYCYCIDSKGNILWTFKSSQIYMWMPYSAIISKNDSVIAILSNQLLSFNKGGQTPNWSINHFEDMKLIDQSRSIEHKEYKYTNYYFGGFPSYNSKTEQFYCRLTEFSNFSHPPPVDLGGEFIISGDSQLRNKRKYKISKKLTSDLAIDTRGKLCGGTINGVLILTPNCQIITSYNLDKKIKFCIIGPKKSIICADEYKNLYILK